MKNGRFRDRLSLYLTAVVICIVALFTGVGIAFAQATGADKVNFFANINWAEIGKYASIVIGGGLSINVVIGIILALIPNPMVYKWCTNFGIFLTKIARQKISEVNVDTISTTLITALRGIENGIRIANPDIPVDINK
ncbi:MAG: hypothetical protein PHX21_13065 [bacterium]|nr:hypothetical protein [bacterium]